MAVSPTGGSNTCVKEFIARVGNAVPSSTKAYLPSICSSAVIEKVRSSFSLTDITLQVVVSKVEFSNT